MCNSMQTHEIRVSDQGTQNQEEEPNSIVVRPCLKNPEKVSCVLIAFIQPVYSYFLPKITLLDLPQKNPLLVQ